MNYLAHIYLSGDNEPLKLGNFMADSIKGKKYLKYPKPIQKGIVLHRAIDYYTDTHPVVMQSIRRLFDTYSHYSGVIVDIFYDHYLAANWSQYSNEPLPQYIQEFYRLLEDNYEVLPKKVKTFMPYMIKGNWLLSYSKTSGIEQVLKGMDRRTNGKSKMGLSIKELNKHYEEFKKEFELFFPDLIAFSNQKIEELDSKLGNY